MFSIQNLLAMAMENNHEKLDALEEKLKVLRFQQHQINSALNSIREEMDALKNAIQPGTVNTVAETSLVEQTPSIIHSPATEHQEEPVENKIQTPAFISRKKIPTKQLEDIIGTNIINKIGILITIVGVFIGVKYAIDKDLISAPMRIGLGYALAIGLMAVALQLKNKYLDFSSVIMSGGVTILYFISFIAYSFYGLLPQTVTFALMVAITILAIRMALVYDRKIIALLGQVGAYAVPFLLSDGSGKVLVLFSYISIINIGLLVLSVKKDWKTIYQSAFFVSWLIYFFTLSVADKTGDQFVGPIVFLSINFLTFYAAFLTYKMVKKEMYQSGEIIILLINAIAFYLIGYELISRFFSGDQALTIFTIANAVLHIGLGIWIRKQDLLDKTVYQFVIGLGITFITITVPVSCSGSWITLLWVIEAAALCYIGYRSGRRFYLVASVVLTVFTWISLLIDWKKHYLTAYLPKESIQQIHAFFNGYFASSLVVCFCLGWMCQIARKQEDKSKAWIRLIFKAILPVFFIICLYLTLFLEINFWWLLDSTQHESLLSDNLRILSEILYSQLYICGWLLLNKYYIKEKLLALGMALGMLLCTFVFVTLGIHTLGELRQEYLLAKTGSSSWLLWIRYVFFAMLAIQFILLQKTRKLYFNTIEAGSMYDTFLNTVLLTLLCNEFIHWMDILGYDNQYKLGLSIICGLYALTLVVIGIMKKKQHLRVSAMVLFGATLIKLFFYDLASLSTISKTIVLIILGVILLIASFLYNKFKDTLFEGEGKETQ